MLENTASQAKGQQARSQYDKKKKKRPPSLTGEETKNKIREHNSRMMETVRLGAFFPLYLGYLFVCLTPKQQVEQKWK